MKKRNEFDMEASFEEVKRSIRIAIEQTCFEDVKGMVGDRMPDKWMIIEELLAKCRG